MANFGKHLAFGILTALIVAACSNDAKMSGSSGSTASRDDANALPGEDAGVDSSSGAVAKDDGDDAGDVGDIDTGDTDYGDAEAGDTEVGDTDSNGIEGGGLEGGNEGGGSEGGGSEGGGSEGGGSEGGGGDVVKTVSVDNTLKAKLVDYVLVLDNSSSMSVALANARAGLKAVIKDKVFNDSAKIGVMSTMPASLTDLTDVHKTAQRYPGIRQEPGFLKLATQSQVDAFKAANPTVGKKYSMKMCSTGFFDPYQKHSVGHLCLDAAMQTSFQAVSVEDGILSFSQMIAAAGAKKTFRDGAEVNVVFISDVHAPGLSVQAAGAAELLDPKKRPTAASIRKLIDKNNKIAKLSFHSIVPEKVQEGCTEPASSWALGKSYYALVDATKGLKHSICETSGYTNFFKKMVIEAQAKTAYTLTLPTNQKILEVKVDGVQTSYFTYDSATGQLVLNLTKFQKKVLNLTVKYKGI